MHRQQQKHICSICKRTTFAVTEPTSLSLPPLMSVCRSAVAQQKCGLWFLCPSLQSTRLSTELQAFANVQCTELPKMVRYLPLDGGNFSHSACNSLGEEYLNVLVGFGSVESWMGIHQNSSGFNITPLFKVSICFPQHREHVQPSYVLFMSFWMHSLSAEKLVRTARSFLLDSIDRPFLSSQSKCHDQYCGISLHYHDNPCLGKWQDRPKESRIIGKPVLY